MQITLASTKYVKIQTTYLMEAFHFPENRVGVMKDFIRSDA